MTTPPPHREIELVLQVPESVLPRLRRHPALRALTVGRARTRILESVYWDTPELDLARAGLGLRLRRTGRTVLQTVKTRAVPGAGLFDRAEWEVPVPGEQPDPRAIAEPALRLQVERAIGDKEVAPRMRTRVRRTQRRLRDGECEALLAVDVGEVQAGSRRAPLSELELELVRGDPGFLYGLALLLREEIPLRPAARDKAEIGFALLQGTELPPRRARRPELSPACSVDDALAAVVASAFEQLLANEAPARSGVDPEGVHQMRVGVRRLRSALSVFRSVIPPEPLERFREDLRWLGRELGAARDLDVFLEELLAPLARRFPADPALKRLVEVARHVREEAYDGLRQALDAERCGRLLLDLSAWGACRGWRDQPLGPESARLFASGRAFADERLERRYRKVRRRGRNLARRSPSEKHALRIEVKKLRYTGEFFRSLYAGRGVDRMLRRLSRLQDVLGHLNDRAAADALLDRVLEELGPGATPDHHRAAGLVSGWAAAGAEGHARRLERRWRRFTRTRPFWED